MGSGKHVSKEVHSREIIGNHGQHTSTTVHQNTTTHHI